MSSYNDITGDKIQSRVTNKQFEDNFDRIFGKKDKTTVGYPPLTPDKPLEPAEDWDEKRVDIIGTNGNDGLIYHHLHKHGHRPKSGCSKTYISWQNMLKRVKNSSGSFYKYAAVGFDERWLEFVNFLADMGERPEGCTLDRIESDKGYYKENCRWSDSKQQARNKLCSIIVNIDGVNMNLVDVAEKYGIPTTTIYRRYHKGLPVEDIIRKPMHGYKNYEGK